MLPIGISSRTSWLVSQLATLNIWAYISFSQALFSARSNESPQQTSIPRGTGSISLSGINIRDLARFGTVQTGSSSLGAADLHVEDEDEDEDDDEPDWEDQDDDVSAHNWFPPVTEPQKEGEELLHSGDFGRVGVKIRSRANKSNLMKSVLNQAAHPIPSLNKEDLLSVCFNSPYQKHEPSWSLSTRTSFQITMELQLQLTGPTCILPNFQTVIKFTNKI